MHKPKAILRGMCMLLSVLIFVSCAGGGGRTDGFKADGSPQLADPDYVRTPPALRQTSTSGAEVAEEYSDGVVCWIDTGNANDGYVGAAVQVSGRNAMFLIQFGGQDVAEYPLSTDGQFNFYPLVMGSGSYTLSIYLQVGDGYDYALYQQATVNASIADEFAPFLIPNKIISFSASSAAIQQSYAITENCSSNLEVVQVIYNWICRNITYDLAKAENVGQLSAHTYVPDIDTTLRTKTGICYDYAALAAAMLRANGIPTKLVMGNADKGEGEFVYHAWNEVWLEETGWIAVKLAVKPGEYTRVDTTFASGSDDSISEYIGNGSNYYEQSYH